MRKFTTMPSDAYTEITRNAGIILKGASAFTPASATFQNSDIIGATSGGISFSDTPSFTDFGDDIDNCPKNTKELKEIESREVKVSGTFITTDTATAKLLIGACDIDSNDSTKLVPRDLLESEDFNDIWVVCDYSNIDGGYVALHLKNCLSTGGFSIQSTDKSKGQFSFEFTAHYGFATMDTVPYEVYIKAGTASSSST